MAQGDGPGVARDSVIRTIRSGLAASRLDSQLFQVVLAVIRSGRLPAGPEGVCLVTVDQAIGFCCQEVTWAGDLFGRGVGGRDFGGGGGEEDLNRSGSAG